MARTRSIRPGFFTNEELCSLPPLVRLLFAGLWTVADREGRLLDRPKKLKAELFPYDRTFSVERGLELLAGLGLIFRYSSDGLRCIFVMSWYKHQRPHPREDASKLPAPQGLPELKKAGPRPDPEPDPSRTSGAPPARLVASSSSSSLTHSVSRTPNPSADALGVCGETPPPRGKRANGTNPRAQGSNARRQGTNPRANGANPRALGTNPRAARSVVFEDDGPRYEQRTDADGKREWVEVDD